MNETGILSFAGELQQTYNFYSTVKQPEQGQTGTLTVETLQPVGISYEDYCKITETLQNQYPANRITPVSCTAVSGEYASRELSRFSYTAFLPGLAVLVYVFLRIRQASGWLAGCAAACGTAFSYLGCLLLYSLFSLELTELSALVLLLCTAHCAGMLHLLFQTAAEYTALPLPQALQKAVHSLAKPFVLSALVCAVGLLGLTVSGYLTGIDAAIFFAFPITLGLLLNLFLALLLSPALWCELALRSGKLSSNQAASA